MMNKTKKLTIKYCPPEMYGEVYDALKDHDKVEDFMWYMSTLKGRPSCYYVDILRSILTYYVKRGRFTPKQIQYGYSLIVGKARSEAMEGVRELYNKAGEDLPETIPNYIYNEAVANWEGLDF